MTDFVLVPGAWHGAWCWNRVLPALWQAGHRAFAVCLSGVGERAHLRSPAITLDTHVQDVVALLDAEELSGCVLVGHSYAGMVITGAAERRPERIGRLVYLDAVVPRSGDAWSTGHTEAIRAERRDRISELGWLPPPDPAVFGLAGADRDWVARRLTPQPGGVYDAPLAFDEARWRGLPRTFIDCHAPALASMAVMRDRVRCQGDWTVVEIATGHDAMISAPEPLVAALLAGV
ncbi:MAG: alpha/beta hydrolase family protein [Geothrix sp.]|nr:alpha/beta hydrolase family protein [Geothrix sp.]